MAQMVAASIPSPEQSRLSSRLAHEAPSKAFVQALGALRPCRLHETDWQLVRIVLDAPSRLPVQPARPPSTATPEEKQDPFMTWHDLGSARRRRAIRN